MPHIRKRCCDSQHACYRCQHACYGPNMRFCKNHMSTFVAEFSMMLQNSNIHVAKFQHGVSNIRTWRFKTPIHACMLQMRTWENLSLFEPSKTGAPPAPHCAHPSNTSDPYAQHSGVRFSHKQHLHLPCTPPKNPLSAWYITKISLSTRTCLVVRTYMRIPALSGTNSAFL